MSKKTQKNIEDLLKSSEKQLAEQRKEVEKLEAEIEDLKVKYSAQYGDIVISRLKEILGTLPSAKKFKSLCDSIEFHNLAISFFARTDTLPSASEVPNGGAEQGVEGG